MSVVRLDWLEKPGMRGRRCLRSTPLFACHLKTAHRLQALSLVYPGDTSAKVLERIMADAAEEAFTDARTQALHAGETLERAQVCIPALATVLGIRSLSRP